MMRGAGAALYIDLRLAGAHRVPKSLLLLTGQSFSLSVVVERELEKPNAAGRRLLDLSKSLLRRWRDAVAQPGLLRFRDGVERRELL